MVFNLNRAIKNTFKVNKDGGKNAFNNVVSSGRPGDILLGGFSQTAQRDDSKTNNAANNAILNLAKQTGAPGASDALKIQKEREKILLGANGKGRAPSTNQTEIQRINTAVSGQQSQRIKPAVMPDKGKIVFL